MYAITCVGMYMCVIICACVVCEHVYMSMWHSACVHVYVRVFVGYMCMCEHVRRGFMCACVYMCVVGCMCACGDQICGMHFCMSMYMWVYVCMCM